MKRRSSLVSNSSSTSWIVLIPEGKELSREEFSEHFLKNFEGELDWDDDDAEVDLLAKVQDLFYELREGQYIGVCDDGYHVVTALAKMCQAMGFCMASTELSSDGQDEVIGVAEKEVRKIINEEKK